MRVHTSEVKHSETVTLAQVIVIIKMCLVGGLIEIIVLKISTEFIDWVKKIDDSISSGAMAHKNPFSCRQWHCDRDQ